ncbi:uncharacterized protein LOC120354793 isoform X2 [Nilaparvata lugens]|uniref:uncharacterized protein LOC120354793 isoform X2 n=1 Tax=Nilaparvata lugens TaxID=108931 RepID=UPI00193CE81D|nr:uncharacterized protein LOC120354793 isoform X2 [Nilaparvata lugens]
MTSEFLKTPDELKVYGTDLYDLLIPFSSVKYKSEPKTILQVVDDVFYFWSPKESCVVAVFQIDLIPFFNGKYQLLRPTRSLDAEMEVNSILVNVDSSKLALVCDSHIVILNIPERSGPGCYFLSGMDNILCKSINVGWSECQYVGRVRWINNDLLLILYGEHMEVRDCSKENAPLMHKWPANDVVDFEILFPLKNENFYKPKHINRIRVFLLKENGDVHTVNVYISGDGITISFRKTDYEGIVRMLPPPEDNYGVEAYSLIVLEGSPRKLVIASRIGVLNHFVILIKENENPSIPTPEVYLYAIGTVELDINGLRFDVTKEKAASAKGKQKLNVSSCELDNPKGSLDEISLEEENNDDFMTAIALVPDNTSDLRYFAMHKAGIHCITTPRIDDYQAYVKALEKDIDKSNVTITVDYIVVTRSNLSSTHSHAPFGVVCVDVKNPFLIMVFQNSIKSKFYHKGSCMQIRTAPHDLYSALDKIPTTPYIDLDESESMTPMTKMELLCLMENHIKNNVIPPHKRVKKMMNHCKAKAAKQKLQQQVKLQEIMEEKNEVQSKAEQLAEKCEEIHERNNILSQRLYECVKHINQLNPSQRAEKVISQTLQLQAKKLEVLKMRFDYFHKKVELFKAVVQQDIKNAGIDQNDGNAN